MYQFSYLEIAEESGGAGRQNERQAVGLSIDLLKAAAAAGAQSRETIEALHYVRKLWSLLIEDLASPGNSLAPELKAKLISIGLWMLKETELIRLEKSDNFNGLIEVSETILAGLQ
jgi:flagellar biosynthesis activator protein FlaF